MSMTFTKLFSSITESTVWYEDANTRLVWITMLAMADRKGRVWASVPGLAGRARVPIEACREALVKFMSPDPDSRTKDFEGRRIEEIDGGWRLINYMKYRQIRDEEAAKESKRNYINKKRSGVENVERGRTRANAVGSCRDNAEAEAEAEGEAKAVRKPSPEGTLQGGGTVICDSAESRTPEPKPSAPVTEPKDTPPIAPKAPKASPDPEKPPSPHHTFKIAWVAAYEREWGSKYPFNGGKDAKAIEKILAFGLPHPELIRIATRAWQNHKTNQFSKFSKYAASLWEFSQHLPEIKAEVNGAGAKFDLTTEDYSKGFFAGTEWEHSRV